MTERIDMSLDDIIKIDKPGRRGGRGGRGRGARGGRASGGTKLNTQSYGIRKRTSGGGGGAGGGLRSRNRGMPYSRVCIQRLRF